MSTESGPEPAAAGAKFEFRKAMIVRAAVPVLNRKGVRGMTFTEIAGDLGLVPTAVNYYFRRKEDLAAACFLQAIIFFNSLLDRSDLEPTPRQSLRRFLQDFAAHLAAVDAGTADPVAIFNDVRTIGNPAVDLAYTDMFRRVRRIFASIPLVEPARLGRNARTHLLVSQVLWAVLWLRQYEPEDYPRMVDRLFDVLVNGLAAPCSTWAPLDAAAPEETGGALRLSQEAFLRAATELINEHGYLGASVGRISARLNVSKGAFYHHNQAKNDLVEQCFDRTFKIMRASLAASEALTTSAGDALSTLVGSLTRRGLSGEAPLIRTSALSAAPEELQARLVLRFSRYSSRLAGLVSDGIADGSIRPVDANVAAQTLVCLINASAELQHWAPGIDASTALEAYARPLFTGILGPDDPTQAVSAKGPQA
ncbi:TetR/AcrR family transcriptional regulator [Lichenicoccus sp.]|uniref:TetR/AcrR family transcriptional regulator n=1 Tax=Lichenicoccus sp. TaxID=2781899 RepID=UPI003D0E8068